MLLWIGKREDWRSALKLLDLLTNYSFEINVFKKYIKILYRLQLACLNRKTDIMRDKGFHDVPVVHSSVKKNRGGTFYLEEVTELLWMQIEFCEPEDIIFCLEQGNASWRVASQFMAKDYIRTCHEKWRKDLWALTKAEMCRQWKTAKTWRRLRRLPGPLLTGWLRS